MCECILTTRCGPCPREGKDVAIIKYDKFESGTLDKIFFYNRVNWDEATLLALSGPVSPGLYEEKKEPNG
jgi:hypothetical protein